MALAPREDALLLEADEVLPRDDAAAPPPPPRLEEALCATTSVVEPPSISGAHVKRTRAMTNTRRIAANIVNVPRRLHWMLG